VRFRPAWTPAVLAAALLPVLAAAAAPPKPTAAQGQKAYYHFGCQGCHLPNKEARPEFKPSGGDLSHIGKRLTAAKIAAKVNNPKAAVPTSLMPSAATLKMSKTDVANVAAYLASLK
jgi:mono/diheme cytochrome c family protein